MTGLILTAPAIMAAKDPGQTIIRSFLGVPLLDRTKQVRGGLLLGDPEPGRFNADDEALLIGLASQAAVAIDNVRLYQAMHTRAQELDAIFQSIADGVTLVDPHGRIIRENMQAQHAAHEPVALVVHQDVSALKEAEYLKRNRTSPYANQKQKILHLILSFLAPR